jgi:long-chain fatty acid transport protein
MSIFNQTRILLQLCLVAISLAWGQPLLAAAFYIDEVGTPVSLGTAGVANPTNTTSADAAWTNPAGMTGQNEDHILTGLMVAVPKVEFDSSVAEAGGSDGGNAGDVAVIPSFFYTHVVSDKSRVGFSVVAPLGGGIDYGDNFVGRYAIQNVSLEGLAFTPSFAYKVDDRLSLGVGVSAVYTTLEQDIAINGPGPGDGKAKFEDLDDWGYQGVLGLTYQVTADTLLGVVYRSEMDVDLDGDLKIKGLAAPVPNQSVDVSWKNPQTLEVGLKHALDKQKSLAFKLGWQDWSRFSKNSISVDPAGAQVTVDREWDDTWNIGAAYAQKLDTESVYTLGISYESSPVKDKHRTFDFPVDEIWKLASSYAWAGQKNLDYSVGATLYMMGDAEIDQTSQGVRATGEFDNNLILFLGGTLRYIF